MNVKLYLESKKDFETKVDIITSVVDKKNNFVFSGITKDNKNISLTYGEVQ